MFFITLEHIKRLSLLMLGITVCEISSLTTNEMVYTSKA